MRANPSLCSFNEFLISAPISVTLLTFTTISWRTSEHLRAITLPVSTFSFPDSISWVTLLFVSLTIDSTFSLEVVSISELSFAALPLIWASLPTSSATTEKPLPWAPALAASTEALNERSFVWKTISLITFVFSPISLITFTISWICLLLFCISSVISALDELISSIATIICSIVRFPFVATSLLLIERSFDLFEASVFLSIIALISSTLATVSCKLAACWVDAEESLSLWCSILPEVFVRWSAPL